MKCFFVLLLSLLAHVVVGSGASDSVLLVNNPALPFIREMSYKIESKVWNKGYQDYDDLVESGIAQILDGVGLGYTIDWENGFCSSWWHMWKNWKCEIVTLLAIVGDDDENAKPAKELEKIDTEILTLFQNISINYSSVFSLTWITRPHPPKDQINLNYTVWILNGSTEGRDPRQAMHAVEGNIYKGLERAGFPRPRTLMRGRVYSDHAFVHGTYWIGKDGEKEISNAASAIRKGIQESNQQFDWFNVTEGTPDDGAASIMELADYGASFFDRTSEG